jgi:hypothetical protein
MKEKVQEAEIENAVVRLWLDQAGQQKRFNVRGVPLRPSQISLEVGRSYIGGPEQEKKPKKVTVVQRVCARKQRQFVNFFFLSRFTAIVASQTIRLLYQLDGFLCLGQRCAVV